MAELGLSVLILPSLTQWWTSIWLKVGLKLKDLKSLLFEETSAYRFQIAIYAPKEHVSILGAQAWK